MTFFEYLHLVRRRWIYLAIGVVVGIVGGFLTAPGRTQEPLGYQGTHTLIVDDQATGGGSLNLDQAALLATTGPVPARVGERLAKEGLPAPTSVIAAPNLDVRSLAVTARSPSEAGAAKAADYTAEEVNAELNASAVASYNDQIGAVQKPLAEAQAQVQDLDAQLAGMDEDDLARGPLTDQRTTAQDSVTNLTAQLQTLQSQGAPVPPFKSLEAAKAAPAKEVGWRFPETPFARALTLAIFGLVLGLVGAFVADRLDTRVRGKADAQRAFDLPVIVEIPPLTGSGKGRDLLAVTKPASPFVESYRALRTVVLFAAAEADMNADHPPLNGSSPRAKVILVTSPAAGEGKTTTAAHLAAVLAEAEKKTLVISADFRRPRIHDYFDVPREPGLSDVLASGPGRVKLSDLQMATSFPGVHLLPSGSPVNNPARLLTESAHLIAAARTLFDYIVIDTPPLLVANDATELAAEADMVILVAKADRTSREAAHRAAEILRRVEAPVLGVVVSAAHDIPTAYGYYKYRYYAESDQGGKNRSATRDEAQPLQPANTTER